MGYVKDGMKRYRVEVVTALLLFFAAGWLRRAATHYTGYPTLLLAVKLLPLLPILLIGWAVWRFYRNSDELQRQTLLKTAGASALLSFVVLMGWTVLLPVGLPPLTGKLAPLLICGCTFLCAMIVNFQGYRADGGIKQGLIRLIPALCLLLGVAGIMLWLNQVPPAHAMPGWRGLVAPSSMVAVMALYWLLKHRFDS